MLKTTCGFMIGLVALLVLTVPDEAFAQYCALRQPAVAFQEAFQDENVSVRSFDRQVTEEHRERIAEVLPFTIHRNELGTHTLYAAIGEKDRSRGYIHVRSERGKWGLTELAWAIHPNLTVKSLRVQRCRSFSQDYLQSTEFQELVRDKGVAELRTLLSKDGTALHPSVAGKVRGENQPLAIMAIRSALKTLLATEMVWETTLASLGYEAGKSIFDDASQEK